jgi:predicted membrane protein
MNINLHLTDDTQLRAHGFVAASGLFAEVQWDFSRHGSRLSEGALWGTPSMMRQLAELAVQAAIQAEEEAAWQAHERTTVAAERSRVA